jgi:hypothetical protein
MLHFVSALRFILRHCGVPQVRLLFSGFASLELEYFTKPSFTGIIARPSIMEDGFFGKFPLNRLLLTNRSPESYLVPIQKRHLSA